ncbi:MAG: MBL fold metallo-hydrolase [Actinomycetota bacterium]|nr:MBL fold metallo-hydrolase [Actinomycetota bacterium]
MADPDTPGGWSEVAERCFVRRYDYLDVSCTAIVGGAGVLVVDTRASLAQGRRLREDLSALTAVPVSVVVNTHVHFDHHFGNGAFPGVPLVGHESLLEDLAAAGEQGKREHPDDDVMSTDPVPVDTTFSSAWATDLGDRYVEVVHLGRGHTAGDVLVRVPDADLLCAGDLVESSAPPSYGEDCHPLEWGATLEQVSSLIGAGTVVVPGHGPPVGRAFVLEQRLDIVDVGEQVRALAHRGVPLEDALGQGQWPFPAEGLQDAVRRGYEHAGN